MKLSVSNIAWSSENDASMYNALKDIGFNGLEIAPTRIFVDAPYDNITAAAEWSRNIYKKYGLSISSMQSIWYGRQESLFGSAEERCALLEYTRKAIDFAAVIGCGNLVFGCPKNRNMPEGADEKVAVEFFREIGSYAAQKGTVIGLEANPTIYNTNFINTTEQAIKMIEKVNSPGFKLNLDIGTMIYNNEDLSILCSKVGIISHVHISEPYLKPPVNRDLHKEIINLLSEENYTKYVSIEMGRQENISDVISIMNYVRELTY